MRQEMRQEIFLKHLQKHSTLTEILIIFVKERKEY